MEQLIYILCVEDEKRTKILSIIRKNKISLINEIENKDATIYFQVIITQQQVDKLKRYFKFVSFVCEYNKDDESSTI